MSDKTAAQVLREAADHVEKVGLIKGTFFEKHDVGTGVPIAQRPCCALGAIGVTSGYFVDDHTKRSGFQSVYGLLHYGASEEEEQHANAVATLDTEAVDALAAVLDTDEAGPAWSVPAWSDDAETTAADVAAAMRKAAERIAA